MGFQPYRDYVATARKTKSKTARKKKAKDVRIRRGGRTRTVNAPKSIW